MCCRAIVDVAVARVLDNVALVVRSTRSPVATVVTDLLTNNRVAVCVKSQCLIGTHACAWQRHVNGGRICLWRLQSSQQTFSILLCKDCLLIQLTVDGVGKEVATSHEVSCARDRTVADNGDLITSRCAHQGH